MNPFKAGEYVIYKNGSTCEIGKVKRVTERGAFVYYHEGDTASHTPFSNLYKINNAYTIKRTSLGGE